MWNLYLAIAKNPFNKTLCLSFTCDPQTRRRRRLRYFKSREYCNSPLSHSSFMYCCEHFSLDILLFLFFYPSFHPLSLSLFLFFSLALSGFQWRHRSFSNLCARHPRDTSDPDTERERENSRSVGGKNRGKTGEKGSQVCRHKPLSLCLLYARPCVKLHVVRPRTRCPIKFLFLPLFSRRRIHSQKYISFIFFLF